MEIEIVGDLNFNIIMAPTAFLYSFHNSQRSVQLGNLLTKLRFVATVKPLRSFGTIPEYEYSEETICVFFWELFRFRYERNIVLFILLPIAE